MRLTWLRWTGAELEVAGAMVVVDPQNDAGAVVAPFGGGEHAQSTRRHPDVAGLLTHLYRDHADAAALSAALARGVLVLEQLELELATQERPPRGIDEPHRSPAPASARTT